jgi:peptidoglycan/xylan/chitin deacetylase (PgdA/CDA1 family)
MATQTHAPAAIEQRRRSTGRAVRVTTAAAVGLAALVLALTTAGPELVMNGPSVIAVGGTLAGVAGVALLVLAYRAATAGRRRRVHLLGAAIVLLALQFIVEPAFYIGLITHAPTPAIRSATTLGYSGARDVAFTTPDGVRLAAWYVPGQNGAAVILMHGSHGTRTSELPYLRFLAQRGYAVLAVDARGDGESGGKPNALGWYGDRDVAGAYRFLSHQPGVDPHRIAGLGLSMGAEELLRAAAQGVPLQAVVADGAGASTSADAALNRRGANAPIFEAVSWLTYRGVELLSGEQEPPGLIDLVHNIRAPVLLIASNAPNEYQLDQRFAREIGGRGRVWHLPDTGHTQADATHPAAYRNRVLAFLATSLAPATTPPAPPPSQPTTLPTSLRGVEWSRLPTTRHVVALTFDGGSNADGLPSILSTMRATGVPATFFLTGDWAARYPDLARPLAHSYPIGNPPRPSSLEHSMACNPAKSCSCTSAPHQMDRHPTQQPFDD